VTRQIIGGVLARLASQLAPICEACTDAAEAEDRERHEAEEEQQRLVAVAERIHRSGLPEKYHALTLDQLDHTPALIAAALAWVVDGGGLLLTGEVGRGKTMIAGVAARQRLERAPLMWLTAPLLFARLGSGLSSPQRDQTLEVLSGSKTLVLDDIDKTRPTEYGAEQTFLAVDQRVEHKSPLLVTSNLAPSQLAARWPEPYGAPIASRLVGYCRVLKVEGVDRRLAQAAGRREISAANLKSSNQEAGQ
jgi:DNA replication protein DnaC